MTKRNIGLIVGGVMVAAGLVGIGIWIGDRNHSGGNKSNMQVASQTPSAPSGGLSVSSGNAASLGQLNTGGNGQAINGGSSSANEPNPSSFAEYDKYKNNESALFGDIKIGNGPTLDAGKKAAVYYKGWLTNGALFDQSGTGSDGKAQAFVFTEGAHQVIPGWEQGVLGMKVGGSRLIIVPPAVGYGDQARGSIPPNSVLVFKVQLTAIQ